jgi:Flp pilus assembly protein TadG
MQLEASAGNRERGAIAILLALSIVLVLGIAAFVVDIGSGLVTRAQLQNASDAGSLAAGRELIRIYEALPPTTNNKTYVLTSGDQARIFDQAYGIADVNKAGNVPIAVLSSDLVYGTYDHATGEITPTTTGVRAISLLARRDATANGVVETTLGGVLGVQSLSVRASAAVGISSLGAVPEGSGDVPVGISSHWFDSNSCGPNSNIRFFPTGDAIGCAGWHTFNEYPANASRLGKILDGLRTDSYESPATTAGQTTYNFTGGTVASRFSDMKALYDAKKDADGNWDVLVPVYQDATCSNPNGAMTIIGFARTRIYQVTTAPQPTITANVECGVVDFGSGNGPNDYGVLYASPGMIQ